MAYSNYGAWVFRNGIRRKDRESAPVFSEMPNKSEIVWQRVWQQAQSHYVEPEDEYNIFPDDIESQEIEVEADIEWYENIQHAVIGDGEMRIAVYKDFADLYIFGDKVIGKPLIKGWWERFYGRYWEPPYQIRIRKYHKRKIGWDVLRWKWIIHPGRFFLWIDPCGKWIFLRNWCFLRPCWNFYDRMEIWMYNKENEEYWYAYTGMETGSIHHGDKIPRKIRKQSLKYM